MNKEGRFVRFHGYTICTSGQVYNKRGNPLKYQLRERRGGKVDAIAYLYYNGTRKKWTLSRLIAACFLGPIDGYEINHKDRNPLNNHVDNLERVTASENQKHWRNKR